MSHCGGIMMCLPYNNEQSMHTLNTSLEIWTRQVEVSGYHDSSSSLQRTKLIVQIIELEKDATK